MNKYTIKEINVGVSKEGCACGPCGANCVAEVKLSREDNSIFFAGMVEVDGTANFWAEDCSRFEKEINMDYDENEEFPDEFAYECIEEFYENIDEIKENDEALALAFEYVAYLNTLDDNEVAERKKTDIGNVIGSFEIPVPDIEADIEDDE